MLNYSLKYFWEEVLKKNKVLSALLSIVIFVQPIEQGFQGIIAGCSLFVVFLLSSIVCSLLSSKIPYAARGYVYIIINTLLVWGIAIILEMFKIFEEYTYLNRVFPILAVGSGLIVCINRPWTVRTIKNSVKDAGLLGAIDAVVLICYGIIREILGRGYIFNIEIKGLSDIFNDFKFFGTVSGGFILMGFIMAAVTQIQIIYNNKKNAGGDVQ